MKNKKIDGGKATIIEPSKNNVFRLAIVSIDGSYPKEGYLAENKNKTEAVFVADGNIEVTKDGTKYTLNKFDTLYFEPGEKYKIKGKATVFVAITPGDSPSTEIIPTIG